MKYEYKIVDSIVELNELGQQGWKVIMWIENGNYLVEKETKKPKDYNTDTSEFHKNLVIPNGGIPF